MWGDTISLDIFDLSNTYFHFDKETFKVKYVKAWMSYNGISEGWTCPECGAMTEDNSYCTCCGGEIEDPQEMDTEEIVDYYMECVDFSEMEINLVKEALRGNIFNDYCISLAGVISEVLERVEFYIEKLENSDSNMDKMTSLIQALSIAHVHGEIFQDYIDRGMYNFDSEQILNIRENGLESEFDREVIKEWLSE
jgi:hypothetical protein